MRGHAAAGGSLVASIPAFAHLAPAVRASHERWDGAGYPDGLAGERIPLAARIIAACDTYEAIVTDRPYRPARTLRGGRAGAAPCRGHPARRARRRRAARRARRLGHFAVVVLGGLAQALASPRPQRRGDVAPVAPRRATRKDRRRERAQRVCPRGQPAHRACGSRRVVLAHVQVAVARHFHDAPLGHRRRRQLLVVDRRGARHVHAAPAGVAQPPREVDLVGVDEEARRPDSRPARPPRGAPAAPPTGTSRPRESARRGSGPSAAGAGRAPRPARSAASGNAMRRPGGCRPVSAGGHPRKPPWGVRASSTASRSRRASAPSPR